MSERANNFKIGLFIIGAAAIAVVSIVALGAGTLFRDEISMETYIAESVHGLEVGAPVVFRGVKLGEVSEIDLVRQQYETQQHYVLVRFKLREGALVRGTGSRGRRADLAQSIAEGLRVRLASQGVTGTCYLETDYLDPERFPVQEIDWQPRHPFIPSTPATLTRFTEAIDRILVNLETINIEGLTTRLQESLETVSRKFDAFDVERLNGEAVSLLAELRETNQRLGRLLESEELSGILSDTSLAAAAVRRITDGAEEPLQEAFRTVPDVTANAGDAARRLEAFTEELITSVNLMQGSLRQLADLSQDQRHSIASTVENLRLISQNLLELTEEAKQYPSQVLFGEPPPRSKVLK